MQKIWEILQARNAFDANAFLPVHVGAQPIGFLHRTHLSMIAQLSLDIQVQKDVVHINPALKDAPALTAFFRAINEKLVADGILEVTHDAEMCPIATGCMHRPFFHIYRYATPFWGMRLFGVHLNALQQKDEKLHMWVSRRAMNRQEGGTLDHLVSGAVVSGLSVEENLYKEAAEEAHMPRALSCRAIPTGVVACSFQRGTTMRRFTPFVYELYIPDDFVPVSQDESATHFFTLPLQTFMEKPEQLERFKTACQPVIISLLLRYGFLKPDNPYYIPIVAHLLQGITSCPALNY